MICIYLISVLDILHIGFDIDSRRHGRFYGKHRIAHTFPHQANTRGVWRQISDKLILVGKWIFFTNDISETNHRGFYFIGDRKHIYIPECAYQSPGA